MNEVILRLGVLAATWTHGGVFGIPAVKHLTERQMTMAHFNEEAPVWSVLCMTGPVCWPVYAIECRITLMISPQEVVSYPNSACFKSNALGDLSCD